MSPCKTVFGSTFATKGIAVVLSEDLVVDGVLEAPVGALERRVLPMMVQSIALSCSCCAHQIWLAAESVMNSFESRIVISKQK